jgi:hypothetical protein
VDGISRVAPWVGLWLVASSALAWAMGHHVWAPPALVLGLVVMLAVPRLMRYAERRASDSR